MTTKRPKIPPLDRVFSLRDKLFSSIAECSSGQFGLDELSEVEDRLGRLLPKTVARATLRGSLIHLVGRCPSGEELRNLCWRLAGNLDLLKTGQPLPQTFCGVETQWCPAQVIEVVPAKAWASGKPQRGWSIRMRFLAGLPCPKSVSVKLTNKVVSYLVTQPQDGLGFSPPWKDRPFSDGVELTGLRLIVEALPEGRDDGLPKVGRFACTSSLRAYNLRVIDGRKRIGWECPRRHAVPCHLCPSGQDECRVACRPKTLVWKPCERCLTPSWHEPSEASCASCTRALAWARD